MQERKITNELITEFEMYLYEEERSGNTIEKYMRDIRLLLNTKKSFAKDMR